MEMRSLPVTGAFLSIPSVHRDLRGEFCEAFSVAAASAPHMQPIPVAQINTSWSRRGTLRGLHMCTDPGGQAKIVLCSSGAILDIIVDARSDSPDVGRYACCVLDSASRSALYVPPGVAHSFLALTDATVVYASTTLYDSTRETTIDALDPELGLPWPRVDHLIRSQRDSSAPTWSQAVTEGWLPVVLDATQWQHEAHHSGAAG